MTVLVVGPPAAGKSTTSQCIGEVLGLPILRFHTERIYLYGPFGYTHTHADERYRTGGSPALHRYETKFELQALDRAVSEGRDQLLDVSGGVLLQYDEQDRAMLATVLSRVSLVVLTLPYPSSMERCVQTLVERIRLRDDRTGEAEDWLRRGGEELLGSLVRAVQYWRQDWVQVVDTSSLDEAVSGIGIVIERYRTAKTRSVERSTT